MKKVGASLVLALAVALALAPVAFARAGGGDFTAVLAPLNGSGAGGEAELEVRGARLEAKIESEGLEPNLPHLQHIHGRTQAISECPSLAADTDADGLVSVAEGAPFYGPILASFTTRGDTGPASGGALDRFPVANGEGELQYSRTFRVPPEVAGNLGRFAVVQHGVDLNDNGVYDDAFEVSLPATCGKILAD